MDSTAMFGMPTSLFLADGTCINMRYQFTQSGVLTIFSADNCLGLIEKVVTSSHSKVFFNSTIVGSIGVQMVIVSGAAAQVGWITNIPPGLMIPTFKNPLGKCILLKNRDRRADCICGGYWCWPLLACIKLKRVPATSHNDRALHSRISCTVSSQRRIADDVRLLHLCDDVFAEYRYYCQRVRFQFCHALHSFLHRRPSFGYH